MNLAAILFVGYMVWCMAMDLARCARLKRDIGVGAAVGTVLRYVTLIALAFNIK